LPLVQLVAARRFLNVNQLPERQPTHGQHHAAYGTRASTIEIGVGVATAPL
jgi:hypothetical protein